MKSSSTTYHGGLWKSNMGSIAENNSWERYHWLSFPLVPGCMDESTGSGVAGSVQWGYQYIPHSSQHPCSAIPVSRQCASRFDNIRANAVANDKLDLLLNYVKRYWMDSSTFPLSTRNVYRKETQTNNNCKGWHRRISHCAMEKAPLMYCLILILFSEAEKLPLQKQMVEDRS